MTLIYPEYLLSSPPDFIVSHKKIIAPNQQFSIMLRCKGFSSFELEKGIKAYRIRIVKLPNKKQNWFRYKQYFFNQFVQTPPSWDTNRGYELAQKKLGVFMKSWLLDNTPNYDILLNTSKYLSKEDPNYSEYFLEGLPSGTYFVQIEIPGSNTYPIVSNLVVSDIFWKYKINDAAYDIQVVSRTNGKPLKNVSIKTYTLNFSDFKALPLQEYINTYSPDNNGIIRVNRNKKGYRIFFIEFINGKDKLLSNSYFYFATDLMESKYYFIPEEICSDWLIEDNSNELEDPIMSKFRDYSPVYLILEKNRPVKWYKNPHKRLLRKCLKMKCKMHDFYHYKILNLIDEINYQVRVWRKGY